jgi:hypothetical protein
MGEHVIGLWLGNAGQEKKREAYDGCENKQEACTGSLRKHVILDFEQAYSTAEPLNNDPFSFSSQSGECSLPS